MFLICILYVSMYTVYRVWVTKPKRIVKTNYFTNIIKGERVNGGACPSLIRLQQRKAEIWVKFSENCKIHAKSYSKVIGQTIYNGCVVVFQHP